MKEAIDTTDSHPFYVHGQGFPIIRSCGKRPVPMRPEIFGFHASRGPSNPLAGETLSTPDGQTETVVGTTSVANPQGVLVYNFTVADDHTALRSMSNGQ
ncbi:MAG: hypothetical protein ACP5QA_08030 [Phycisphaerae bacterium]